MSTSQERHFEYQLCDGFYYECIFHKSTRDAVEGWYWFMVETIEERKALEVAAFMVDITPVGLPPLNAFSARLRDFRKEYPTRERVITAILYKDSFVMTLTSNLLRLWGTDAVNDKQRFFHVANAQKREQAVLWVKESYAQMRDARQMP